jgi:dTDP-4-amino-4,6-dideoxygalactose transaminase
VGGYEHIEVGLNSRLDALQAAVLRIKLRHLEGWSTGRRTNSEKYRELFDQYGLDGYLERPEIYADRKHVFNQYTVRVPNGHRDGVVQYLRDRQVGCGVYYPKPLHLQTCFEYLGYQAGDLPEAEKACLEVMSLPIFAELTDSQLETVAQTLCDAAAEVINGGQEFRKAA